MVDGWAGASAEGETESEDPGPDAAEPTTVEEPRICGGCGILAQDRRAACESCGAPSGPEGLHAVPQPGGGYWVAVRATFACNACRFDSPLNHFELDDGVVCVHCGLEQRYDRSDWQELVDFAHRVGDFGSGGSEGRFPDARVRVMGAGAYPDLGRTASWVVQGNQRASPGNPLCRGCRSPLRVEARQGHTVTVNCPSCGERRSYELPPNAQSLRRLAGVLADEHEAGGREAKLEAGSGVVVLACPHCAAPLEGVSRSDGVFVCGYCRAPCRISARSHARVGHRDSPPKTWWLYFDEPCPERRKLLNTARQATARADKARERAEQRERSMAGQAKGGPPRSTAEKGVSAKEREKRAQLRALLPLLLVFAVATVIALVICFRDGGSTSGTAGATPRAGVGELQRFSFQMSSAEVGALFGVDGSGDWTVELDKPDIIHHVQIYFGGRGGPNYQLMLFGGEQIDLDATLARLAKVAPNQLKRGLHTHEINVAKSLLRIDPRVQSPYRGSIQVATWVKDDARARTLVDAFWAVARYAIFGRPEPSAEQLALLNGPALATAGHLDPDVAIELASNAFRTVFPDGACQTQTDLNTSQGRMVCSAEVDHPLVSEIELAWPHGSTTLADGAALTLARRSRDDDTAAAIVAACLDAALGPGEDVVVDHATGRSHRLWSLDPAGDKAELDGFALRLQAPASREPTRPAGWSRRFREIVAAVDGCRR